MRPIETRYLDPRGILTQVYTREKNFRSTFMMTKTVRAAWMSRPDLRPGPGWGYGGRTGGKFTVSPYSTIKCNCILRTPHILPLWPWDLASLARLAGGLYTGRNTFFHCSPTEEGISLAPHLTTRSRISYSVTYTISRIPISLYYLLYLFFLLFYYILCFTSPAHPSALHLVYP